MGLVHAKLLHNPPPPLLNNRCSPETVLSQCSTHVTPTKQRSPKTQSATGALYTPARLVRRQTSRSIRPHTKPKRAWTPTPCHCQRGSGECTAKVGYHRPGAKQPSQPRAVPSVPHQTQNQWASAHHNTKPKKAWTPNPQQCGSGVGQRTIARRTATPTASNISAGHSHLYKQLPGGPPPAHTGSTIAERKRPTHDNYNTGAAMEPKPPAKA